MTHQRAFGHLDDAYEHPDDIVQIDTIVAEPGGQVWLHVRGDLDRDTVHRLTSAFAAALTTAGLARLELNLAEVAFVDAAGARCLLTCRKTADAAGIPMTVRNPSPAVLRVLDALGLHDCFDLPRKTGTRAPGTFARGGLLRPANS
ncbi:STAS domain-containing protein [Catenuloplanes indicus]|uniref:Anti-sigma B factor antagonist n=1 Tax=Catenuloplanes indicus TaxID=137267 RepID=A0AAE3W7D3_9ACTN|nr:STAS domain-containing protein [Catenuloplanes indicus]MDQ0371338.1 anti-sigma B factor antagonist [Catenuloplanes indicus]